jgi:hypothetical protein
MLRLGSILTLLFLLSACATQGVRLAKLDTKLPRQHELRETPFFPQELYQCGPAALATSLNAVGVKVRPDALTDQVYIPSRKGSLQIEMLAAARRHGTVAMKIRPALPALLEEVAGGNPVVVLQNMALSWAPTWHYAVVVGYDLDRELIWLRSGPHQRMEMAMNTFERTWARSEHWGFITLPPGKLPASQRVEDMVPALIDFEKTAKPIQSKKAYHAAANRWPESLVVQMGLGNTAYASGDMKTAKTALQQAVKHHPDSAAAHNNLAHVLLTLGELNAAKKMADKALQLSGEDAELRAQVNETLQSIQKKMGRRKSS